MKNDDFLNRGERLKEERKRLDIKTQDELAEILGVKKNSVVRYEKHNDPLLQLTSWTSWKIMVLILLIFCGASRKL